jgi:hypothetical protein
MSEGGPFCPLICVPHSQLLSCQVTVQVSVLLLSRSLILKARDSYLLLEIDNGQSCSKRV